MGNIAWEADRVVIALWNTRASTTCPHCGRSSEHIQIRYVRKFADLPWQGFEVQLQWRCRRFFCTDSQCIQRIFTERVLQLAAPHACSTSRLTVILRAVTFACGGEQGAFLADRLGIAATPNTLLREIRRILKENCPPGRIVGVDDWALRRGKRYATILVDLERHLPVELLPDWSSEAFRLWLKSHP